MKHGRGVTKKTYQYPVTDEMDDVTHRRAAQGGIDKIESKADNYGNAEHYRHWRILAVTEPIMKPIVRGIPIILSATAFPHFGQLPTSRFVSGSTLPTNTQAQVLHCRNATPLRFNNRSASSVYSASAGKVSGSGPGTGRGRRHGIIISHLLYPAGTLPRPRVRVAYPFRHGLRPTALTHGALRCQ
jgi:hypothetical protein